MTQLSNATASRLIRLLEKPMHQFRDCIFLNFGSTKTLTLPSTPDGEPCPADAAMKAPPGYRWVLEGATISGSAGSASFGGGQWVLQKMVP